MEGLDELIRANVNHSNETLIALLNDIEMHQSFDYSSKADEKSMLGFIHEELNNPSSRIKGIYLLSKFVKPCRQETFMENVKFWISSCLKYIENNTKHFNNISLIVLEIIIEKCSRKQELNKTLSVIGIWRLVNSLQAIPITHFPLEAFRCIETMLRHYGSHCIHHKSNLESLLYSFVNLNEFQECRVKAAARCIALLPLAGSSNQSANQNRWLNEQMRLISAIHDTSNELLDGILEIRQYSIPENAAPLPLSFEKNHQKDNFLERIQKMSNRLNNLLIFLTYFIGKIYPKHRAIHHELILEIISRILNVTPLNLGVVTTDKLALGGRLPSIHQKTFHLLQHLIYQLQCEIIYLNGDICQNIVNVLRWTGNKDSIRLAFSSLRKSVYETLNLWLNVTKSSVEDFLEQLVTHLLADIHTPKKVVKISVGNLTIKKHLSKKERRQKKQVLRGESERDLVNEESHPDKLIDGRGHEAVCVSALVALQTLYRTNSDLMPMQLIQKIHKHIFPLALEVLNSNSDERPFPYASSACRKQLYILIQECSSVSHSLIAAPISKAINLLSMAREDSSLEVSMAVQMAYEKLTQIIHPTAPSIEIPVTFLKEDSCNGYKSLSEEEEEEEEMSDIEQFTSQSIGVNETQPEDPKEMEVDANDSEKEEKAESSMEIEEKEQAEDKEEEVEKENEENEQEEEEEEEEEEENINEPCRKKFKIDEHDNLKEENSGEEVSLVGEIQESTPSIASLSNNIEKKSEGITYSNGIAFSEEDKKEIEDAFSSFVDILAE